VTWETSRESILRGCIGTLSPRRLRGGLAEYALLAGTRDSRFPPVTDIAELERLAVKISLLHSYETLPTRAATTFNDDGVEFYKDDDDVDDDDDAWKTRVYDWDLDTHGLSVEFFEPPFSNRFLGSATYLPGVAKAQGWTKRQTLASLAAKAGVDVSRFETRHLLMCARATRYKSSVARATHEEYRARP
jgi:AMMECR1 domain-containing protein